MEHFSGLNFTQFDLKAIELSVDSAKEVIDNYVFLTPTLGYVLFVMFYHLCQLNKQNKTQLVPNYRSVQ